MNILVKYVLLISIEFAGIIHVIADGVDHTIYDEDDFSVDEDSVTDGDGDFSISDDTERNITNTNDTDTLRSYVRYHAAAHKHYKKSHQALAYTAFQCCVNEMKVDLEYVYPRNPSWVGADRLENYELLTKDIQNDFPLPDELARAVASFSAVEAKYCDQDSSRNSRAVWQIEMFFRSMSALLSRCTDQKHYRILTPRSWKIALSIKAEVLRMHNLAEQSEWSAKKEAIGNFSSSYAKCRYACNGIHRVYAKLLRNSKENLPELLYSMGLLQAWNFTVNDLEYMNLVRSLGNKKFPLVSAESYSFKNDKGELVTGILPVIDADTCSRFS